MATSSTCSLFEVTDLVVVDGGKPEGGTPIHTGIGYLDHMVDQWNSHAQVGIGMRVAYNNNNHNHNNGNGNGNKKESDDPNRLAGTDQVELCKAVGSAVGMALRPLLPTTTTPEIATTSRFCCPLDEALVECILSSSPAGTPTEHAGDNNVVGTRTAPSLSYDLEPYGIYPRGGGRTKIGGLATFAIESFWRALGESSGLQISLRKIRGDNAHHIVESTFKAFSRALRNHLDSTGTGGCDDRWAVGSPNDDASVALRREGTIDRSTRETSISVHLSLNGGRGIDETEVDTGIPMLDEFYTTLAREANMTLKVRCHGDLWVDDHHTAEDVSIAVGQCLVQALGSKAGLNRMWVASASTAEGRNIDDEGGSASSSDATKVEVTMDLSNRPCLVHNLHETLGRQEYVERSLEGDDSATGKDHCGSRLTCEMLEHCLDSLVMNGRMTVHIVEESKTANHAPVASIALCVAKAFGRALRVCAMVDQRRAGTTASSKGTLSV
jgi:imidazoleglycerol-phosphate dehydratase